MMTDTTPPNGQFEFLNALRKGRAVVTLYLVNGIRLQGRIASFDRYAVLLQSRDGEVLIQNHAISTIGRDAGHGARKPRDAGQRGAREGGMHRAPRDAESGPPGMGREPAHRAHRPDHGDAMREPAPEPRRTVPTVTIVRKGMRRVRVPGGTDPV